MLEEDHRPVEECPPHVRQVLKHRIHEMSGESAKEILTRVLSTCLASRGRPREQAECLQDVWAEVGLWPQP